MEPKVVFQNDQYFYEHPTKGFLPIAPKGTSIGDLKPFLDSMNTQIKEDSNTPALTSEPQVKQSIQN